MRSRKLFSRMQTNALLLKLGLMVGLGLNVMTWRAPGAFAAGGNHTITIDGTNDFAADEDVPGTSGSTWYFTWDATNFYFAVAASDVAANSATKWVWLYLDTDPQQNPLSGLGSSTGVNYNSQTPGLPFRGDYHFRWKTDNSYTNMLDWNNGTSSWTDDNTSGGNFGIAAFQSGTFVEFKIPRASLGNPSQVYVCGAMINEQTFVESTFFITPQSNAPDIYDKDFAHYFGFPLVDNIAPDFAGNEDTYPVASIATGNYSSGATWTGGVAPHNNSNVFIQNGHTVTLDATGDAKHLTVISGGTFNGSSNTLNIAGNGLLTNNGTFNAGTSTVVFDGAGTVAGTIAFNTVVIANGVNFGSGSTVNGTLRMNTGGFVNTNAPTYGSASTLLYSSGLSYNASAEWTANASSGVGVPQNVQLSNATTLNLSTPNRTANGNLTIDALSTLTSTSGILTLGGNFTNNGAFTHSSGNVTFNGSGTKTVSGSSPSTAFNTMTLNMGNSASVLDVVSPISMATNGLTLTQGTFKLSSASTITPFSGSETIPSVAGFHLNHASAVSSYAGNGSLDLDGKLIIDAGTMSVGNSSGNQLLMDAATSEATINGGALNLDGRIRVVSSSTGNGLTITGGEVVVTTNANNSSGDPNFNIGATGKFTMTGGTVTFERANSNVSGGELVIASGSGAKSITGGTIRVGNAATPAAQIIEINSAVPIFNFTVNSANATAQLANALDVNGDLSINAGSLDANNLNLNLAGNWTNNGTFTPGTGTVTLDGASPQTMSGSTFNNLTINNASGVTLLTNETVNNTLSLLNGNVTTGANTMIIASGGTVARTSGHIVGNLQKHFAAAATQTFEVGDASNYTPIDLTVASVSTPGNVVASTQAGDHASIASSTLDASKSVNRNWTLTQDAGFSFSSYDATFNFVSGDLDGGANTSNLIVGKFNSPNWSYPTVGTRTLTSTQATGMTSFSDFQLAECTPPSVSFSPAGPYCENAAAVNLTAFVSPAGGTFTGNGVTSAGIFTPSSAGTGTHTITYTFTSNSNCTNSASQDITVNPLPNVTFNAVSAVCFNAAAIDLTSYVSPSGGTFTGDGVTTAGIFTPSSAGTGTHTITYTFTSGSNCTNSASQNIVVNPLPSVTFNAVSAVCVNAVAIDLTSYVSPAGGTFSGNGVTSAGIFTPSSAGEGTHTITYSFTDGNSCTNTASQDIVVNPLPNVTFNPAGPYCLNSPAVDLTSFVSPSGGTFSGTGVTAAGIFTPSSAGIGTHTITYSFTDDNSCTNTASQNIAVETLPTVMFDPAGPYCVNAAAVDLTTFVSPSGGTFSGNGVTSAGIFTPSSAGTGTHTITYTFTSGSNCTNSASQDIVVNPLPVVTFNAVSAVCLNASAIDLTSYVSPAGGTFSGDGVTAAGIFTPSDAGAGTHTITYSFTDGNTCSNSASQDIVVNPLPVVTFSPAGPYCLNSPAVDLTSYVSPSGGTFSGTGVTAAGIFTPSTAGVGTHTITYSFTDGNNCTNSASQNIMVETLPTVTFTSAGPYCVNAGAVDLTTFVSPAGGTFTGEGVTAAGIFTPSAAGAGTHTITYTFTSGSNCTNSASQDIVVNPLPNVTFTAVSAVCVNAAAIDLTSYVSPAGGTFSGNGVTAAGIFTPSSAGAGTHTITYSFTDGNSCTNSASQDIVVNPLPSVTFNPVGPFLVTDAAVNLASSVSPSGGTFSGPGISGTMFDPSVAGVGTHTVTYSFTDGNSCTNSASQNITVNPVTPPAGKAFVFLSNKITLKRTKQSTPAGDMHANGALTIEKGDPSTYNSNLTATGKITIQKDNTLNGNVKSPLPVSNSGTVNGTITIGAVANEPLPGDSYTAGGLNKTVPNGGSLTLAPGSYGIVTLNHGGTLKLTSGTYLMNELRYPSGAENGVIEITLVSGQPAIIKVVSNFQFGQESAVRLLPNGENDSELVTFFTLQSSSITLGRETYLLGNFNAPNAKVTLAKNSQLRGALCVKELLVERDCLFLHHGSPGALPGPGNLPKMIAGEVEEVGSDQLSVTSYQLSQNYPNPFNPSTVITFQLPAVGEASLKIYNLNGRLVRTLVNGEYASGKYEVVWDGKSDAGTSVATGLYVYVFRAGEFVAKRKLVLMK